ncbi:MAG: hypothetical protein NTW12_11435 [Deltaproteobacteria bacterium]|nr:hypothetical protein [Deltaproteobacteria bacterium]
MRKFCLILLSIGLITAFSMPAAAADVKFDGSYVAQGTYDNNRKLADPTYGSVSSIWQRARIGTTFKIAEGLTFTTRFDAMEKVWGAAAGYAATPDTISENIKFENAFVTFAVPIGTFQAGYMNRGAWGTVYGNNSETDNGARARYIFVTGPVTVRAVWDKVEGSKGVVATQYGTAGYASEHDSEKFALEGWYKWNAGEAGLQLQYVLDTSNADSQATGYKAKYYAINPYAKAKFGPVYVEAELGFATGKYREYITENATIRMDQDISAWRGYIMANADLKPAYVGAVVFYASGDKKTTDANGTGSKYEGGVKTGNDFNPCLILMNYDMGRWYGAVGNYQTVANNIDNVFGGQLFAGIKPMPKLDVKFNVTTAKLNENPTTTELVSKKLGYEADLTAAYKIYDNLEYMIGFGYLWAGDAFKGTSSTNKVENDYLVTHKLTLTF